MKPTKFPEQVQSPKYSKGPLMKTRFIPLLLAVVASLFLAGAVEARSIALVGVKAGSSAKIFWTKPSLGSAEGTDDDGNGTIEITVPDDADCFFVFTTEDDEECTRLARYMYNTSNGGLETIGAALNVSGPPRLLTAVDVDQYTTAPGLFQAGETATVIDGEVAGVPGVVVYDASGLSGFDDEGDFATLLATGVENLPRYTGDAFAESPALFHSGDVPQFIRGDTDGNGVFNGLVDCLYLLEYGLSGGPPPPCLAAADADGDFVMNTLIDALFIVNHGFGGGAPPPAPYPLPGAGRQSAQFFGCLATGHPDSLDAADEPCEGGYVLVTFTRNECKNGIVHVVTYSYYQCPDGTILLVREGSMPTSTAC